MRKGGEKTKMVKIEVVSCVCKHLKLVVSKHLLCKVTVLVSQAGARASSLREATGQEAVNCWLNLSYCMEQRCSQEIVSVQQV